jgi:hypothetical protein
MQYCSDKDMNQLVKRMVRTGWIFGGVRNFVC